MVDRVQKVSGLITASASTSIAAGHVSYEDPVIGSAGSELGTVTTRRLHQKGSEQTRLSKLLSPPAEPPLEGARSAGTDVAAGLSALAICSLLSASTVAGVTGQADISVYGVLLAFAAVVGVVALLPRTRRIDERLQAKQRAKHADWEAKIAQWNELYYCWRDDVLFIPGSPTVIPVTSMWHDL
jgi:hypothetical protein